MLRLDYTCPCRFQIRANVAAAAYQLRATRCAESLLHGVVRCVAHCDRAADSFCAHNGGHVAAVAIVSRDHHQVVLADRRRLDCDHDLAGRRQCDDARRCGGIEERLERFQPRPLFHAVMVEEVTISWRVLGACHHNGPPESRQSPPHVQAGSSRRWAPMMKEARVAGTFPTTRHRWRVPFSIRTSPGDSDTSAPSSSWSARVPERTTPKSVVSGL